MSTASSAIPSLSYEHRHGPIRFGDAEEAHPINFTELYNLKGRLLTLVDATFQDPEQRKAQKDLVWNTLRDWMQDVVAGGVAPPSPELTKPPE